MFTDLHCIDNFFNVQQILELIQIKSEREREEENEKIWGQFYHAKLSLYSKRNYGETGPRKISDF